MTDLREKIAELEIDPEYIGDHRKYVAGYDAADAILALLRESVRPLDWEYNERNHTYTSGPYCIYNTMPIAGESLTWVCAFTTSRRTFQPSLEAAKAAAQADYTRRVLSAMGLDQ